jgi:nicotinamidase-related amidase
MILLNNLPEVEKMGNKALIVIDYTNDFIHDEGGLSLKAAGQAIDKATAGLMQAFGERGDHVFILYDCHHLDDDNPESWLFPPHNIAGTWGGKLYGETGETAQKLLAAYPERVFYLPKERFSVFFDTELDDMLKGRDITHLTFAGVCTDICVLHSMIAANYLGYTLALAATGCEALTPMGQEWALAHIKGVLGAEIV